MRVSSTLDVINIFSAYLKRCLYKDSFLAEFIKHPQAGQIGASKILTKENLNSSFIVKIIEKAPLAQSDRALDS